MNANTSGDQSRYSIIRTLRFGLWTIVGLVLVLVVLITGALIFISSEEAELRSDSAPQATINEALRSAVVDQETAIRGFLITGDDVFLESFYSGRQRYLSNRAALEERDSFNAELRELRSREFASADAWYDTIGLPAIDAGHAADGPVPNATVRLQESKRAIDRFRQDHAAFQTALESHIDDAERSLDSLRYVVFIIAATLGLVVFLLTALVAWTILRSIRLPLAALDAEVNPIDAGDTSHRIPPLGPLEFDRLGSAINRMLDSLEGAMTHARVQQRRFATIVESANEGIIVIDQNGIVTTLNPEAARMFGVDAESAVGQPVRELGLFDEHDLALGLDRLKRSIGPPSAARPIVRRFGDVVLSAIVSPLAVDADEAGQNGTERGLVCVVRDVTELTRIDEMKNEFISVVSHELRTPLTAIKGFTDLILEGEAGEINEAQRDFLEIVQSNSDRLVALINDMLDISRIESGRISLNLDEVAIPQIIDQAVTALGPLIGEKQLNYQQEISDSIPVIMADASRLVQVLTNLISNACKYTPAGGWVTLSAEPLEGMVAISVSDTGIGIPADALPRVFSKFYRVDHAAAREVGGTGLGLAITKSLVEMHGGRITIASRPNIGTTVRFTLPTARPTPTDEGETGFSASASPVALVATADDEQRSAWEQALRRIPATTLIPRSLSVPALVAETEQQRPSVILIDASAGIDMSELLDELRSVPEHASTPIVFVGMLASVDDNHLLTLPPGSSPDETAAAIDTLIDEQRATIPNRGRVLVAEDDADSARWIKRVLSNHGFEVLTVTDGLSALVRAIETMPDIIILDVNMPKMGASEVLPQLRENPGTRDIPIVVMSGTVPDSRPFFIEAGATEFFVKPVDADALIRHLIDLRKG